MSDLASAPAALTASLADRYRIEGELGQGGMATVYLAHDIRHDRNVAVKVLRPELAAVIGAERFLAEIRTTANLQHPHILPLFDSGVARLNGSLTALYYVMPYVEGISLRQRLTREKQLPIADAIRITTEVAAALDYAHRHGVIHRDIKPENILLHDGSALVADFGIALAASKAGTRMTETGMSLGTPQYMSPEQAMGERELDARSDEYALGCVAYEMLTGEPPFSGPTAQAIVAKVLTAEPATVTSLRRAVPIQVAEAIHTALQKLPADRFATVAAFAEALASTAAGRLRLPRAGTTTWLQRHALPIIAALGVIAVVAVALAIRTFHAPDTTNVNRFDLALGANETLAATGGVRLAWSPDGRSFAYSGTGPAGTAEVFVRALDSLIAMPLAGTAGASSPVFSPDGQFIAYLTTTPFSLRVVPRTGGTPRVVISDSISGGGCDWADDGYIYFDGATTISRIRPDGTGRQVVAALDTLHNEIGVAWPQALPNGRGVIFRVRHTGEDVSKYSIDVVDGKTHARKRLVTATMARYSPAGYLLYVLADGTLMASRFDLGRLALTGTPVVIARNLDIGPFGAADLALARDGSLLYATGGGITGVEPVWVARDGATSKVDPAWGDVFAAAVALSPDGSRLAIDENAPSAGSTNRTEDIWVKQLPTGPLSRLTTEGEQNRRPSWSPDGRDIIFVSSRSGPSSLFRQRADGSAPATQVQGRGHANPNAKLSPELIAEGQESPDGHWIVAQTETTTPGDGDIMALQIGVDTTWRPMVATRFQELAPALSPNGRWLAYSSNETGRPEVYVRPFPNTGTGKIQLSTDGGTVPHWSARGDELYFISAANEMMAARVRITPDFAVLGTTRLFSTVGFIATAGHASYDVSADGRRFLMLRPETGASASYSAPHVILVEHFLSYVQRVLP